MKKRKRNYPMRKTETQLYLNGIAEIFKQLNYWYAKSARVNINLQLPKK